MTDDTTLSRRTLLGAVGTIGGAAALGGAGSLAFFSDAEAFANNELVAGELDLAVAYSEHYSDWSPDEDGGDTDTADDDVAVRMWDGAPDTTGGPDDLESGETGLPTDDAWLVAVDDPEQFLANTATPDSPQGDASTCGPAATDADDLARPTVELGDVKPGDFGEVTVDLRLCDNPGYLWLEVANVTASENGYTEPERDDGDEDGPPAGPGDAATVELLDVVRAAYWVDDGDNYQDGDEVPAFVGSLREVVTELSGAGTRLAGDVPAETGGGVEGRCFSPETPQSVAFAWWLPVDHGNEVQGDSVQFDLGFYTEQCRHNDGVRDPLQAFLNDEMLLKESPNWDGSVDDQTGQATAAVANNALTDTDEGELPLAFDPLVVRVDAGTEVVWTWRRYGGTFPAFFDQIPHNVVSLDVDGAGAPLFESPLVPAAAGGPDPFTWSRTFSTPGVYPYYCTPHGAPFPVGASPGEPFDEALNEFGMRGAVLVE
jgi:predicted ribosomally synthesized peptide with SipW-like signal peptide